MRSFTDVRALPTRVTNHLHQTANRLARRAQRARGRSQERIWHTRVGLLERAEASIEALPDLPLIRHATKVAGSAVHSALASATVVPIEDYDTLNAKTAIKAVRSIDHFGDLLSVRHREASNKARKTVLRAIDERHERLRRGLATDVPDLVAHPA